MLKSTIVILPLALAGVTGCTFENGKCPDGFVCTRIADTQPAGGAGTGGGNQNGAGGRAVGNGGSDNGSGGAGHVGGSESDGGDSGDMGGHVTPTNPGGTWTNATGDLAGTPSGCGTIYYVTTKPGENLLILGVAKRGVFTSTDSGKSWSQLGTGMGSASFGSALTDVVFDPEHDATWWLSGIRYGSPFRTDDDGETFQALANFDQNDGISVDLSDPDRKTLLVGGHEQNQMVQYSDDGGNTWQNIGVNLPADAGFTSFPYVVDDRTFMLATSNSTTYRTTNKGDTWSKVVNGGGGAKPLKHSDGSLYWAARESGGLVRSTDDGETWSVVTPPGVVFGMTPIELPDGRIAMRSAMGMLVSEDKGANWRQVTPPVPNDFWWYVSTYNAKDKAFYTTRFACEATVVNADGLMRYPWDYTKD
ncbi:MAG TPA: hypothetical protein VFK05_29295 [Polyangiaceae bacterium]|nr:hypothetical protein [Polyangiaceae bacterium]